MPLELCYAFRKIRVNTKKAGPNVQSQTTVLQRLALPDPDVLGEEALFWTRTSGVWREGDTLRIDQGAAIDLAAYLNVFHPAQWQTHTGAEAFTLALSGKGKVALRISAHGPNASFAVIHEEQITLPHSITLPAPSTPALWSVALHGIEASELTACEWSTALAPEPITLAICITTFKREAEVTKTIHRLEDLIAKHGLSHHVQVTVVDNGQSLTLPKTAKSNVLSNRNLGGSGGFTRGLLHARENGASHCLFMDDDAACLGESILRTLALLSLAPRKAICGAMIAASQPTLMWENGAVFQGRCKPQFIGTNLTRIEDVTEMELSAIQPKPANHYGGWWFFAFPLEKAKTLPHPFFVRGDDISFSLANEFEQVTLGGVVSVQEDFSDKETPLTQYLDLRNHLSHYLVHPSAGLEPSKSAGFALRFIGRSLLRMHYETCEALLLAWSHMIETPDLFETDPEAANARAQVAQIYRTERWTEGAMPSGLLPPRRNPMWKQVLSRLTLNGHLIPFWTVIAPKAAVHPNVRAQVWPVMMTSGARIFDRSGTRSYAVTHSKRRFFSITARALLLALRWSLSYQKIRDARRASYARATSKDFWRIEFEKPLN